VAAEDQPLQTKYHATKTLQTDIHSKCRLCQKFDKATDIISACPIMVKEQYIKRHDRVCAQLQLNICNEIGVKLDKEHWYEHVLKLVETSQGSKVTILWNEQL
jgi:hypothetical protein